MRRRGRTTAARNLNKIVSFHVVDSRVSVIVVVDVDRPTSLLVWGVKSEAKKRGEKIPPKRKQDQADMDCAWDMISAGRTH